MRHRDRPNQLLTPGRRHVVRFVACVAMLGPAGLVGCEASRPASQPPEGVVTRDSAGVSIIDLGDVAYAALPRWRMGARPSLDIGEVVGEGPYLLHDVVDAEVLSDRSVALVMGHELRRFDSVGTFRWSQGRPGDGPGDYTRPYGVTEVGGDTLVVFDVLPPELNVISPEGEYVRGVSPEGSELPSTTTGPPRILGAVAPDRIVLRSCTLGPTPRGGYGERETWCDHLLADLEGAVRGSLGSALDSRLFYHPLGMHTEGPWSPRAVYAAADGGLWYGAGEEYELRFHADSPSPARILRWRGPDRSVTPDDVTSYDRYLEERFAGRPYESESVRFEKSIPKPDEFPPYHELRVDRLGRLWLRDYERADVEEPEVIRWTVLSPGEARAVARFEHPRGVRIHGAGEGWVMVWERDELDVEHVRIYPLLERPSAPPG